jgi:hypothetical protein
MSGQPLATSHVGKEGQVRGAPREIMSIRRLRKGSLRAPRCLWSILVLLLLLLGLPRLAALHSSMVLAVEAGGGGPAEFCGGVSEIPRAECEALAAVYSSTDGPNWIRSTNWLETTTPCAWYGVTCAGGHVTGVELSGNQLGGTIPSELGNLGELQRLGLASNGLTGGIPPELGELVNLSMLMLYDNQLSGPIPPELSNMVNLAHLRLYTNQLSGSIPPELGQLPKLTYLVLKSNRLSGSIPPELGNLAGTLRVLYLSCNQLSGEVPRDIAALVDLHSTDLGYNMLTASDPQAKAFLDDKDPDWVQTQTVPPADVRVANVSDDSVELAWTPIAYTGGSGYYEVSYATTPGGPYTVHGTTSDKTIGGYLAANLPACPAYYFAVRTYTPADEHPGQYVHQQSNLWSTYSREAATRHFLFFPLVVQGSR